MQMALSMHDLDSPLPLTKVKPSQLQSPNYLLMEDIKHIELCKVLDASVAHFTIFVYGSKFILAK